MKSYQVMKINLLSNNKIIIRSIAMQKKHELPTEEILNCPIYKTMEIFQGKWNSWILFELGRHETMRFGELRKAIPGIENTTLSKALKYLEEVGLIERIQYNEIPPHVEYKNTEAAKGLRDVFAAMWKWGEKYGK